MGLRAIFHWGPLLALGIVKIITWMTMHSLRMWWPPWTTFGSSVNVAVFLILAGGTLYYFLSALTVGPGFVPLKWHPENEEDYQYLQYCSICEGYKPPRAHHCRKCGFCVKKMDHHCPWINGCVGWANHLDFTMFLFFAILGCAHATTILCCSLYRGVHRTWYLYYGTGKEPIVEYNLTTLTITILALGLSIGVVVSVGMLFYLQMKSVLKNRTAIEEWIEEKANHRLVEWEGKPKYIFPYDLGMWKNFRQVFLWNHPSGDGINWTVNEGCHKYSLTMEQLIQKAEKRNRSRLYQIDKTVHGGWCQFSYGICTVCRPPCTEESRIALDIGDSIVVTRWRRYWLFGEKIEQNKLKSSKDRIRGWFPRNSAIEIIGDVDKLYNDVLETEEDKKDR